MNLRDIMLPQHSQNIKEIMGENSPQVCTLTIYWLDEPVLRKSRTCKKVICQPSRANCELLMISLCVLGNFSPRLSQLYVFVVINMHVSMSLSGCTLLYEALCVPDNCSAYFFFLFAGPVIPCCHSILQVRQFIYCSLCRVDDATSFRK